MWQTRAIEITSNDLWSWHFIMRVVAYARQHHFNALILGQPDLLDKLVAPDGFKLQTYDDHVSNLQRFNCNYINKIARHCVLHGIDVYLQCKEISITPELFISHPELLAQKSCREKPDIAFWRQYLTDKLILAMHQLPMLKGVFLAISNTDSLVRFATPSGDEFDLKKNGTAFMFDSHESYGSLYSAVEKVMRRYDKRLIIRLFPANYNDIDTAIDSISHLPPNVGVSVKITPERFWPEFPNNPALLSLAERDIWVEFDFAGEEVGWGHVPCLRHEEIQGRILWCQENITSNKHIVCRITWDGINNVSVLNSLSEFSLYACASYLSASSPTVNQPQLFAAWLQSRFDWSPDSDTIAAILECLDTARQAIYGAIYVKKHVFHRHSMLPNSYGQAVWSLYGQLNRNHWLPGSQDDITFAPEQRERSSQNLYHISQEKDEALRIAEDGHRHAMTMADAHAFPPAFRRLWLQEWSGLSLYCRMFAYAQKAFFTLRYCHQVDNSWPLREIARANMRALHELNWELTQFSASHIDYPVSYDHLFDAEKAFRFTESLYAELELLDKSAPMPSSH
ncbi:hypothetical protein V2I52_14685 [Brenneria sp. g21c3]|uniref:hypothetical protein n=1 Tax=Brenneria sp. g21c3 TaxID=3093893 RepID=UPI002EBB9B29|nr:hypothetical protein [Brenneria sp. g21c3]